MRHGPDLENSLLISPVRKKKLAAKQRGVNEAATEMTKEGDDLALHLIIKHGLPLESSILISTSEVCKLHPAQAPWAQILMEIEHQEDLPKSKRMLAPPHRQNQMWPRPHDTEKCKQLKNKIEALIRCGRLRRYVEQQQHQDNVRSEPPHLEAPPKNRHAARDVHMVSRENLGHIIPGSD